MCNVYVLVCMLPSIDRTHCRGWRPEYSRLACMYVCMCALAQPVPARNRVDSIVVHCTILPYLRKQKGVTQT